VLTEPLPPPELRLLSSLAVFVYTQDKANLELQIPMLYETKNQFNRRITLKNHPQKNLQASHKPGRRSESHVGVPHGSVDRNQIPRYWISMSSARFLVRFFFSPRKLGLLPEALDEPRRGVGSTDGIKRISYLWIVRHVNPAFITRRRHGGKPIRGIQAEESLVRGRCVFSSLLSVYPIMFRNINTRYIYRSVRSASRSI
jgi:hypothetical protein